MRRHIAGIIAAGLLLAGCTGGSGGSKPEPKATAEPAVETTTAPVKLSDEWTPKLDAADDKGGKGVCKEVGSPQCVEHVTRLTEVVYDVETAIEEAEAEDRYPKSMKHIGKVEAASEAYVESACEGSTDKALGTTPCAGYAATLLLGPATLSMTMTTDEYSK